ncbi:hypothetical protein C5167_000502 [Papaver somniferum]|uniref:glutaminase n=1 Tax=Papaver somniferum TaxID=3469 RepID=A0A4Y7KU82_PAPSO|nr:hypothetical protein C5167_000502 [Papaver somniferum]
MTIGVLALQGSYNEHISALRRLGVKGVEIKKPGQLDNISALIIPGGESTTMAKLAEYHNLFPALREFVKMGKPVWGTCAGLIFLADKAIGQKEGGQELVGGLDCTVHRNFFGSQIQSFEVDLSVPELSAQEGGLPSFRGVFIRAPAIVEAGPGVEVLAACPVSLKTTSSKSDADTQELSFSVIHISHSTVIIAFRNCASYLMIPVDPLFCGYPVFHIIVESLPEQKVIVAVKQGNLLGTAFHPELTGDTRWHSYFLKMLAKENEPAPTTLAAVEGGVDLTAGQTPEIEMPIYQ